MQKNQYQNLLQKINIKFSSEQLLDTAFVHKSFLNEYRKSPKESNERLEFLGDAVLEFVATDFLYKNYPKEGEGVLTNWRSALVKGKHLAEIARDLKLGEYLYLSKGEEAGGGRNKNYILANTLEALIGAIYLDTGYENATVFINDFILINLDSILKEGSHIDAKSKLQEKCQDLLSITPQYKLISDEGPDHDKIFTMGVYIDDEFIAEGKGSSKQKAEQEAARNALVVKGW